VDVVLVVDAEREYRPMANPVASSLQEGLEAAAN
jgi:hypothetical protein